MYLSSYKLFYLFDKLITEEILITFLSVYIAYVKFVDNIIV